MTKKVIESDDAYTEAEAAERFERALRGGLATPPISTEAAKKKAREPKPPRKSSSD